jgi:hypothetical protein
MAQQLLIRLRKLTGQPKCTFSGIRNACAVQLNNYKITDIDMKHAIGHRKGTQTYAKHYRSKRSSVDLQGLVTDGIEDRQRIKPPPKFYIPPVQLMSKDMDEFYNNAKTGTSQIRSSAGKCCLQISPRTICDIPIFFFILDTSTPYH